MATESTAIVNLLDLVKKKPLERDVSDDLLFGGQVRFDPMAMPAPAHPVMLPQPYSHSPVVDEAKTHRVTRVPAAISPKKLAVPVGLFVVAMIVVSIVLAKSGGKHAAAAKTTVVHAPQPTVETLMPETPPPPAPQSAPAVVAAAAAPAATPTQQPTVTEIPTEAPAAAAQPTVPDVQPTVPTVPTVADAPVDEQPVAKPAASKHHHHAAAAKRAKPAKHVAVADDDDAKIAKLAKAAKEKSENPQKAEKAENLGGKGALQISSSPARVLWVDGRDTKSMTPQKVTLTPGTHNITLFDKQSHSAKTFQVEIKPNQTTRVSKSY